MAINVNMISPDGVTLATSGKYCEDNVQVVPTFWLAENARHWEYTITGAVSNSVVTVLQDDWLKEHYNDENLCFYCLKVDNRTNVYANLRVNTPSIMIGIRQCGTRMVETNGEVTQSTTESTFVNDNPSSGSAGFMYINSNGELSYRNGSGVRWEDGTYNAIAWLA